MKLDKLLRTDYIQATEHWKETYRRFSEVDDLWDYIPIDKVPVKKIRIDKSLLDYPNDVNEDNVTYMINNFQNDVWDAIMVNDNFSVLDGQHRLRLAERTGLKYIDVIMKMKKTPELSKKIRNHLKFEKKYKEEIAKLGIVL